MKPLLRTKECYTTAMHAAIYTGALSLVGRSRDASACLWLQHQQLMRGYFTHRGQLEAGHVTLQLELASVRLVAFTLLSSPCFFPFSQNNSFCTRTYTCLESLVFFLLLTITVYVLMPLLSNFIPSALFPILKTLTYFCMYVGQPFFPIPTLFLSVGQPIFTIPTLFLSQSL